MRCYYHDRSHCKSSSGSADECRLSAGWPPTLRPSHAVDLDCESAENWQLPSTSTIATVIIIQPVSWYSFYRPTEGGRLSNSINNDTVRRLCSLFMLSLNRPKHCSKGAQPVPKAVYCSSCRDKHNCPRRDSSLGPVTRQSDALTTRLLRRAECSGGGNVQVLAPVAFAC